MRLDFCRAGKRVAAILILLALLLSGCAAGNSTAQPEAAPAATVAATPVSAMPATEAAPGTEVPRPTIEASPTSSPSSVETPGSRLLTPPQAFDGQRAYEDVNFQVALGPRTPESEAHAQQVEWMQQELAKNGWVVEVQEFNRLGHTGRNVIAKRGSGKPWTIIGAHYDSRMRADNDPDASLRNQPVIAANDGASGVAVLTELSRVLPQDLQGEIWLAFFDLEDQGNLPGWDWILGSRALAESLKTQPDAVVIVDMIGDADLNVYREKNSTKSLTDEIWSIADQLGYAQNIIPEEKWTMIDDHTPFLERGIPAVDMIDFDYPYWHTTQDTADKVAAQSLKIIGDTVLHWLLWKHSQ